MADTPSAIAAHEAGWRDAVHAAQWGSTLTAHAYPELAPLPVAAIDTRLVVRRAGCAIWKTT